MITPIITVAIRGVVFVVIGTIIGLVALNVFHEGDNTALSIQIIGMVAATTASLLAFINSMKNSSGIQEAKEEVSHVKDVAHEAVAVAHETKAEVVHTSEVAHATAEQVAANTDQLATLTDGLDGRLSQLLTSETMRARLLGHKEGGIEERNRQDTT